MGIKRTALIRLSDLCPLDGLNRNKMWRKMEKKTDNPKLYFYLTK